jgi:hypothetical protein
MATNALTSVSRSSPRCPIGTDSTDTEEVVGSTLAARHSKIDKYNASRTGTSKCRTTTRNDGRRFRCSQALSTTPRQVTTTPWLVRDVLRRISLPKALTLTEQADERRSCPAGAGRGRRSVVSQGTFTQTVRLTRRPGGDPDAAPLSGRFEAWDYRSLARRLSTSSSAPATASRITRPRGTGDAVYG